MCVKVTVGLLVFILKSCMFQNEKVEMIELNYWRSFKYSFVCSMDVLE